MKLKYLLMFYDGAQVIIAKDGIKIYLGVRVEDDRFMFVRLKGIKDLSLDLRDILDSRSSDGWWLSREGDTTAQRICNSSTIPTKHLYGEILVDFRCGPMPEQFLPDPGIFLLEL